MGVWVKKTIKRMLENVKNQTVYSASEFKHFP